MTGKRFVERVIDGGSTGYAPCMAHVDLVRLDHFRGFAAAWHIPAGAATAQSGQWMPGPGAEFFLAVQGELGGSRSSRRTWG